jgi:hypothetical protein
MDSLKSLIGGYKAGPRLITALENEASVASNSIPALIVDVIKESITAVSDGTIAQLAPRVNLSHALSTAGMQSFIHPRGKHELAFFSDFLLIKTSKQDISIPYTDIHHLAIIDSIPKDTKGRVLIFLHIDKTAGIFNGKSPLHAVVIQTTATSDMSLPNPKGTGDIKGKAVIVLCRVFGSMGVSASSFISPDPTIFQSATKAAAGVEAYIKAKCGFLFPMSAGLCFLESPATFIPKSAIRCFEFARANGASVTFDLFVHLKDGNHQEFSQIDRSELGPLQSYIKNVGLVIGAPPDTDEEEEEEQDAGNGGNGEGDQAAAVQSDSDDRESDEDFDPFAKKRKRSNHDGDDEEEEEEGESEKQEKKKKDTTTTDTGEEEDEDNSSEEEGSDYDSDSDDDGSVKLVSEDDFSTGQLQNMIDEEKTAL